jgi:predicted transcriptional regulator
LAAQEKPVKVKKDGVRLSLYLDAELKEAVEETAKAERKSVSYFIRETLYKRIYSRRKPK